MPAELPEDAVRIRNLYPIMHCDKSVWKKIIALTRAGGAANVAAAEELAYACTRKTPRTRALHAGTLRKRVLRRAFLRAQKRGEEPIKAALSTLADRAATIINREARDGVVPPSRYQAVIAALDDKNREAYKAIARLFQAQLRAAVTMGLKHSMLNAEAVVARARATREGGPGTEPEAENLLRLDEADPTKQMLTYSPSSSVFKKLFKGALRNTMAAGLFGDQKVSTRVWDLRGQNMAQMKKIIAAGIAAGDDPATISRDIRGLLVQPKTLRGAAYDASAPGRGVYRSAYANAMRLTRTETNRAYIMSDTIFADDKGWDLIWTVSTGQREADECTREGTLIQTNGGEVTIEKVKIGDLVLTHRNRWRRVTKIFKNALRDGRLLRLCFQEGKNHNHEIFCTPNHPFLIAGKWIPACDLKMGCRGTALTLSQSGQNIRILSDDFCKEQQGFEKNSTSSHLQNISEGLCGACQYLFQSIVCSVRTFFYPKSGWRIDGVSIPQPSLPSNWGFVFRSFQVIVSCARQMTSQACSDAFYRNSRCAFLFLEHTPLSNILSRDFFVVGKTSFYKLSRLASGLDGQRNDTLSSNIYDSHHIDKVQISSHKKRIGSAGESCGINRSIDENKRIGHHEAFSCLHEVHMPVVKFDCHTFDKIELLEVEADFSSKFQRIYGYKKLNIRAVFFGLLGLPMAGARLICRIFDTVGTVSALGNNTIVGGLVPVQMPEAVLIEKEIIRTAEEYVYNLAVEEDNSYFANGIAVHNCDDLGGKEMTPEEFADKYPVHPQCLLPGNEVLIPDAVAGAKAFYEGWTIEIRLSGGRKLAVTENHPILTPRGWVAAKFLREGDDVLAAADPERIAQAINPDHDHRPSLVEQIFNALRVSGRRAPAVVKVATKDFHGDARGFQGDIHVVWADRLLGRYCQAFAAQETEKGRLRRRDIAVIPLARDGDTAAVNEGLLLPANGGLCRSHMTTTKRRSAPHPKRVDFLRGRKTSWHDAHHQQPLADIPTADFESVRNGKLRYPGLIKPAYLSRIGRIFEKRHAGFNKMISKGLSARSDFNSTINKPLAQIGETDIKLTLEFIERFSSEIETANIAHVRRVFYSGHVYDLQADVFGLYISNGFFVKNCLCYSVLAPKKEFSSALSDVPALSDE